jgi:hypothetical protein
MFTVPIGGTVLYRAARMHIITVFEIMPAKEKGDRREVRNTGTPSDALAAVG